MGSHSQIQKTAWVMQRTSHLHPVRWKSWQGIGSVLWFNLRGQRLRQSPIPRDAEGESRWDSPVSVQGPRRGPKAYSGTTRYRVHHGKLIPKPRNLQAEVGTSCWPCFKTRGLNKTETAAKAMDDAGWQWPGRTGAEAEEQVRHWLSVKRHIWIPLTDQGIRLVQNKHSIVKQIYSDKEKELSKTIHIFTYINHLTDIYVTKLASYSTHIFGAVSFSQEIVLTLPKFTSLTSHSVLPLSLGVHKLSPSTALWQVFLLHALQDTLSWALCSWTMTLVDASMKAMLTFIYNCLFPSLFPLIHSNQLGCKGHDSSLDPESLEQVCPDPQWLQQWMLAESANTQNVPKEDEKVYLVSQHWLAFNQFMHSTRCQHYSMYDISHAKKK